MAGAVTVELINLAELTLRYATLESVDYGAGGQIYGTMEGRLEGDRLRGEIRLTNLAPRRPDNVNMPTLRGILTTDDGARIWVELDGIATLRESDGARVFTTGCRFRTGEASYAWLNTTYGLLEGVLGTVSVGGEARGRLYECRPTIAAFAPEPAAG
jgi:hypothetical protein